MLGWIADGHADPGALVAGDVEVRVTDTALHVRIGAAHFHIGTNPTEPAHAVKVAAEVAKEAAVHDAVGKESGAGQAIRRRSPRPRRRSRA